VKNNLFPVLISCLAAACTCSQPPAKPTLLDEGEPCAGDELCKTGLCDAAEGFQPVCVRKCSDGCRTGEICTQLTKGHFSCVADRAGLCHACNIDSDCPYPADRCITLAGQKVCGRDCAFDQECPASYHCVNAVGADGKNAPQQCVPLSGSCQCTAASAGQKIPCEVMNLLGTCRGDRTCDGLTGYGACDAKTPAAETCNGLDDDCDGQNDEDLGMVSCGTGLCARTVAMCTAGSPTQCVPGMPAAETCNGFDDDCDGTPDDGFDLTSNAAHCGMCNRACMLAQATPKCEASTCKVDVCDTGFGNCDRIDSNGCEVDTKTDPMNCGACNTPCNFPGAMGTCTNGVCGFTCRPGFIDLNGLPGDGCEYACTFQSMTDLPDLMFVDANCDGIDGELTNGVFVAPAAAGGNNANPGTPTAPKATIAAALTTAAAQGKRDVYVSAGTYLGQVNVGGIEGKVIAGGYAAPSWSRSLINTTTLTGGNPALRVSGADGGTLQLLTVLGANASGSGGSAYGAWIQNSANVRLEGLTIASGDATDGPAGSDGTTGAPGGNAGAGDRGCTDDAEFAPLCTTCSAPPVGAAGTSACGESGGAGGLPGWSYGLPAGNGGNGSPGSGGAPGGLGLAPRSGAAVPPAFANGGTGANGSDGMNGAGGSGIGSLSLSGWTGPLASGGAPGTNGRGGGGGGAGGGGCSTNILGVFCFCFSWGSSGGGGGGGGCAGTVGGAGGSGGSSIGVLLWNSTATGTNLAVTTGRGGNGGRGGTGGPGGTGGTGAGSNHDVGQQGDSGRGGRGGDGGRGGRSGHGGGGAGGSSIGVARSAGSTFTQNNVSYTLGSPGSGGTSSGNAGSAGSAVQVQAF